MSVVLYRKMGCNNSKEVVEYAEILDHCVSPDVVFHEEITSVDGSNRNVVSWLPESLPVKAIVLISHGLNEHSLRYFGIAIELAKRGFGVYSIDHVSHGKSDGKKGIIADHTVLYLDFISFSKMIRDQYPQLPLFLLAHSMGTLVALKSINSIPELSAVVLSGSALFSGPAASSPFGIRCLYPLSQTSFALCLTSVTSAIDPAGPAAPLVVTEITSDPAELELIRRDPRQCPAVVSNKSAFELSKLIAAVKKEVPNIKVPFLCVHGAQDCITLPKSSEYVYTHSATNKALKSVHIVANSRHEPFHEAEPVRSESIALVVAYFETQCRSAVEGGKGIVTDSEGAGLEGVAVTLGAADTKPTVEAKKATEASVGVVTQFEVEQG